MAPTDSKPALPTGTVTFLFTDIEGSTKLLQYLGGDYAGVLEEHNRLLRASFETWSGYEVDTQGDSFFVAFQDAGDAVTAALAVQRALVSHAWPEGATVRVRMGLHSGKPVVAGTRYVGLDVHRAARISASGYGGQVLLSLATRDLIRNDLSEGIGLLDLGEHRLKDLTRPERIFQLVIPDLPGSFPPLKALDPLRNNLPSQTTLLVGREEDVDAAKALMLHERTRLVTFTGPGGTGKTRLALQVAAELLETFEHGAFLVSLAPVADPGLVAAAIAEALGVREFGGEPLLDSLKDFLRDKNMLLLLDNFEQVVAAAPLVTELLAASPLLKIMVTSREVLHLRGEKVITVQPLALPDLERTQSIDSASESTAVELFVQRAVDVDSSFELTEENAPAVAEICTRLDGLPLAIELAAARARLLPPQAMLKRLSTRLGLAAHGARDLDARQQALRSTIAWSHDLLDEGEKALFSRLAVFVGGFTLDAAEAVASGLTLAPGDQQSPAPDAPALPPLQFDMLDGVSALQSKSLLRRELGNGDEPRFAMLETIREYAQEQLAASEEAAAVRRQYAAYFVAMAEEAAPALKGPQQTQQTSWLRRLRTEQDNLRAVLDWAIHTGNSEAGLRLASAIWRFWYVRGFWDMGQDLLTQLLELPDAGGSTAVRATALIGRGIIHWAQGDYDAAQASFEESLAIQHELGDEKGIARSLNNLGNVASDRGDYDAARARFEESLEIERRLGQMLGVGRSLHNLGVLAYRQGDYDAARRYLEKGLATHRELGDKVGMAYSLGSLGNVTSVEGDHDAAHAYFADSLEIQREMADKPGIAWSLFNLGKAACDQGEYIAARGYIEESLEIERELGNKRGIARSVRGLGVVAQAQGFLDRACELHEESLAIDRQTGNSEGIAESLERLASLAAAKGDAARAAVLLGSSATVRDEIGAPVPPGDSVGLALVAETCGASLGGEAFDAAYTEGTELTVDEAVEYALGRQIE